MKYLNSYSLQSRSKKPTDIPIDIFYGSHFTSDNFDLLTQRLNFDPALFCGCTFKEMTGIALLSLTMCISLLAIGFEFICSMPLIGVGFAFPLSVGLSYLLALWIQRKRQGKPAGYLKQKWLLQLQAWGMGQKLYINRSGPWSVGRFM